jgi:hypothetical protein
MRPLSVVTLRFQAKLNIVPIHTFVNAYELPWRCYTVSDVLQEDEEEQLHTAWKEWLCLSDKVFK